MSSHRSNSTISSTAKSAFIIRANSFLYFTAMIEKVLLDFHYISGSVDLDLSRTRT